ncbi:MAG: hypothetical protein K2Q24_03675 [Chitinophagaceae bacterium]|jgi:hypothetical protein|nr:hypothetical protein [Chitinophagaceae bacterium]
MDFRYELQNILSATGQSTAGNLIQTAAHYLKQGQKTGKSIEAVRLTKDEEAAKLIEMAQTENHWIEHIDESRFIARGAEQRVYLDIDARFVIKLNDAVFYLSWSDYFLSLQIHNLFFPGTAYMLIGFYL